MLLIPDILSNGLNFASLRQPLISLCSFKNTNHVTQNLSSHTCQNQTHSNEKLDWGQTKNCSWPVVYIYVFIIGKFKPHLKHAKIFASVKLLAIKNLYCWYICSRQPQKKMNWSSFSFATGLTFHYRRFHFGGHSSSNFESCDKCRVKSTVCEATQNSSHLKECLGLIIYLTLVESSQQSAWELFHHSWQNRDRKTPVILQRK